MSEVKSDKVNEVEEETYGVEADGWVCPYAIEKCSGWNKTALEFKGQVGRIVLGTNLSSSEMSVSMIIGELEMLVEGLGMMRSENSQLKVDVGMAAIEMDRLRAELDQYKRSKGTADAEMIIKASQAISSLQAAYGDDLNWDNIVERAGEAMRRLQTQAPLMQAADAELRRMRARLAQLEGDDGKCDVETPQVASSESPVHPFGSSPSGDGLVNARLVSLEQDLQFFRVLGRLVSRLLGVDSAPHKM